MVNLNITKNDTNMTDELKTIIAILTLEGKKPYHWDESTDLYCSMATRREHAHSAISSGRVFQCGFPTSRGVTGDFCIPCTKHLSHYERDTFGWKDITHEF
jgi:hypothetical protein